MMFFGGAIQLILTIAFWAFELTGRHTELWTEPHLTIPATWVHAYLMLYGIFPFFTLGFLMTTYPKWMNGEALPGRSYMPAFFLLSLGVLLFYSGIFFLKGLAIAGIIIHLLGWTLASLALLKVYNTAEGESKQHPFHLNIALAFGLAGEAFYLIFIATENVFFYRLGLIAGFWLYLIPLLFIVCHRMLPFFSSRVIEGYTQHRPKWSLPLLWLGLVGHAALELLEMERFLFIPDLLLLVIAGYHTWLWGFLKSMKVRLLAVLHISLLWLAIGIALYTLKSLWLFTTGESILGRGPFHLLAIGFITGMVVAMGTRVTLGHSGRELEMDLYSWFCFLGIQLAALLRLLAEFVWPSAILPVTLNVIATLFWLAALIPWSIRYGLIYLKPRVDGQPG